MGRAGKYDRRVAIWTPAISKDSTSGQPKETFALSRTVWARLIVGTAAERFEMAQLHATNRIVWRIRYFSGLTEKSQFRHGGRIHKIVGIVEVDRKCELEVTTEIYE